jgi:hypothetical protein
VNRAGTKPDAAIRVDWRNSLVPGSGRPGIGLAGVEKRTRTAEPEAWTPFGVGERADGAIQV